MSEPFGQYPHGQYSYGPGGAYPVPEPPRRHRARHALGLTATAVVAGALGAGIAVGFSSGGTGVGAAATSKTELSTAQIANRIDPGLVDVTSTLGYQQATAKGTGIVLTAGGEILTNNHVINGATSVSVTDIGNGKTYKATVVGYDDSKDVAVLQLTGASGLTVATLGDSSTVGVGNSVVALGNAEGLGGTPSVATGLVTALDQSITASDESSGTSEQLTGLIETNAGIEPGDSGGPLVNTHGQVVGMDTAASTNYTFGGDGNGGFGGSGGGFGGSGSFRCIRVLWGPPARRRPGTGPPPRASRSRSTRRCPSPSRSIRATGRPPCTSARPRSWAWRSPARPGSPPALSSRAPSRAPRPPRPA